MRGLAFFLAATGCAGALAQEGRWANESTGKPLRPGIYGRIAVQGTPPPVINKVPVMVQRATLDRRSDPVYLYVPPGQVRRWADHCAKWDACSRPVHFVRMDDSPSRLGDWKRSQRAQAAQDSPVLQALNRFVGP
ncbi:MULTISPECIES: hypothetical protein [Ramlibacter]|uniref:Lipoprotein n=1 Tax=Ramlibacter pinisoli TaxID=2682844 RepID=A0A6N8IRJ6_9BURK|nr:MULTISPECIES: hypothetical protein [Ramlibacter]MBA2963884.1 hypothetical protein [Ramlibacter sp. CGMCC 1.13660]MVQ28850.1 hypothetical protein [Ramlibacter pinisoli]